MTIKERVLKEVRKFFEDWGFKEEITMETRLEDNLEIGTIYLIELSVELEKIFKLPEIPLTKLAEFITVGELVEYIEKVVK
jgi:acyl carrier protein